MSTCQWGHCTSTATKVVYRELTNDEKEASTERHRQGATWDQFAEIDVCDEHLKDAQVEYPHIANKEP